LPLAFVTDPENPILIEIVHHRGVLGTLAECGLINADTARSLFLPPSQPSANGPVLDPDHLIPTQRKLTGHRREAGFL
jgi:hypothetical protein